MHGRCLWHVHRALCAFAAAVLRLEDDEVEGGAAARGWAALPSIAAGSCHGRARRQQEMSAVSGEDAAGRGVAACAAAAVFEQRTDAARAQLDLVAVAFTRLAVAHGDCTACTAPPGAAAPLRLSRPSFHASRNG